jgi:two-component system chemotaxis sensor kinase CheA
VARLEEVPAAAAERTGGREVIQHRGAILPLVRLAPAAAPEAGTSAKRTLRLVICAAEGRRAGLVVERILDVVEDAQTPGGTPGPRHPCRGEGTLGAAVIGGQVADLLDVAGAVGSAWQQKAEGRRQ